MASNAPDDDFDRAAARAANLTAIYDSQVKAFVEKSSLFEAVFAGYSAEQCRELSKDSRRNLGFTSPTLAYGEIKFESFGTLVLSLTKHEVDLQHMYNFVDLGSGVGKPVIAAAMLGVFDKCSGIELVPELHEAASKALKQYFKSYTGSTMVDYAFLHGDCTYMDWSATDFVFAHASCFDTASLGRISRTASKMKRGSIFVILSNRYGICACACAYC
jgi:hypothetical protein